MDEGDKNSGKNPSGDSSNERSDPPDGEDPSNPPADPQDASSASNEAPLSPVRDHFGRVHYVVSPRRRHPAGPVQQSGLGLRNASSRSRSNPSLSSNSESSNENLARLPSLTGLVIGPTKRNSSSRLDVNSKTSVPSAASCSQQMDAAPIDAQAMAQSLGNLNLSPRASNVTNGSSSANSNDELRPVIETSMSLVEELHRIYMDPIQRLLPTSRVEHERSLNLLETLNENLTIIQNHPVLIAIPSVRIELSVVLAIRMPWAITGIREALSEHDVDPDFDLTERVRSFVAPWLKELFSKIGRIDVLVNHPPQ